MFKYFRKDLLADEELPELDTKIVEELASIYANHLNGRLFTRVESREDDWGRVRIVRVYYYDNICERIQPYISKDKTRQLIARAIESLLKKDKDALREWSQIDVYYDDIHVVFVLQERTPTTWWGRRKRSWWIEPWRQSKCLLMSFSNGEKHDQRRD